MECSRVNAECGSRERRWRGEAIVALVNQYLNSKESRVVSDGVIRIAVEKWIRSNSVTRLLLKLTGSRHFWGTSRIVGTNKVVLEKFTAYKKILKDAYQADFAAGGPKGGGGQVAFGTLRQDVCVAGRRYPAGTPIAVKTMKCSLAVDKYGRRELVIGSLAGLDSNTVTFFGARVVPATDDHPMLLHVVMEKATEGTLGDILDPEKDLSKLDEGDRLKLIRDTVKGICDLHRRGWMHRDLKPVNVLLTSSERGLKALLCDFGFSREEGITMRSGMGGTKYYVAPEAVDQSREYLPVGDMWALGIIMWELMGGGDITDYHRSLQTEEDWVIRARRLLAQRELPVPLDRIQPRSIARLIRLCLCRHEERIEAAALLRELNAIMEKEFPSLLSSSSSSSLSSLGDADAALASSSSSLEECQCPGSSTGPTKHLESCPLSPSYST